MPALTTARLTCSPLQEQDWPFFSVATAKS